VVVVDHVVVVVVAVEVEVVEVVVHHAVVLKPVFL
jgi:hypothetical protein